MCATEIIVIRPPADSSLQLQCGGADLVLSAEAGEPVGPPDPELSGGTILGKRYIDDAAALEFLCIHPGDGTLTVDGRILQIKAAIALPTTD